MKLKLYNHQTEEKACYIVGESTIYLYLCLTVIIINPDHHEKDNLRFIDHPGIPCPDVLLQHAVTVVDYWTK